MYSLCLCLAATCNEYYNINSDGLIGSQIVRPGNVIGKALRDMCDPPSIGK